MTLFFFSLICFLKKLQEKLEQVLLPVFSHRAQGLVIADSNVCPGNQMLFLGLRLKLYNWVAGKPCSERGTVFIKHVDLRLLHVNCFCYFIKSHPWRGGHLQRTISIVVHQLLSLSCWSVVWPRQRGAQSSLTKTEVSGAVHFVVFFSLLFSAASMDSLCI